MEIRNLTHSKDGSVRARTDLEVALLESLLGGRDAVEPTTLFILGAPRTGSTVLYQTIGSRFELPYIANITNDHFPRMPIVGLAIQKAMPVRVAFTSRYGKTKGPFQPSEGSAVLAHWFGGGHPSALVSNSLLDGMSDHFVTTLAAAECLFERPLVFKNPWNCFRIRCLAETLPRARFVWIRRDIAAAAKSDLAARYVTKGSPTAWNSATPANVDDLRKLPPAGQVVENQREINAAIGKGLRAHAAGRWSQVWYEDFCRNPDDVLNDLADALGMTSVTERMEIELAPAGNWDLPPADIAAIDAYMDNCRHDKRD